MKYKILLAGRNKTVIDDLFSHLDQDIEPMTTSVRWDDLMGHIKYFSPDAFCFCVANESKDTIRQMISFKIRLEQKKIPFVLIGAVEDCAEFVQEATGTADLILQKPLRASTIEESLKKHIDELRNQEALRIEEEVRKAEEAARAARNHILVIDDDSTMLKAIKEQLHEQYDVATALSGKIAMKFLEKRTTDLILLDYEMPAETGPMVLEKLRANEATRDIPVLFLTGVTERKKITQVLALKPQGYLLKPIDHEKLMMTIEKTLAGEFEKK